MYLTALKEERFLFLSSLTSPPSVFLPPFSIIFIFFYLYFALRKKPFNKNNNKKEMHWGFPPPFLFVLCSDTTTQALCWSQEEKGILRGSTIKMQLKKANFAYFKDGRAIQRAKIKVTSTL